MMPGDSGEAESRTPVEIAVGDRRESELSRMGMLPLVHRKNTDTAYFISSNTVHQPPEYEDVDAQARAVLGSRLPYIFPLCRFAHYIQCMARDSVGIVRDSKALETQIHDWIFRYIDGSPETSTAETQARLPLKDARVEVETDPESPGYYRARLQLVPHYQLEGMDVPLSMVLRLPGRDSSASG